MDSQNSTALNERLTDEEIIAKIKEGNIEFFDHIVNRYSPLLYQYSVRMCGHAEDAEDILQETFLNAFRSIDQFRGDSKLSTWLYRIANNSCLMKRRKSKFAPSQEYSLNELTAEEMINHHSSPEQTHNFHSTVESPMKIAFDNELKELVQKILLQLPKHYRQVFVLADLQGFKGQEIADILSISLPSVKSRLHRARLFIRDRLSKLLEFDKK